MQIAPDQLQDLCRRWQVQELALFGSAVRGGFQPESDIDVLVTFEADALWTLWDLSRMRQELRDLFGREVDLVEQKGLRNPFLQQEILATKQVIYAA
ncbi:MAG TPA: nucleotidyltransferase domain-containing protein [Thermoanaerobaculia bacterium]|nr:nucleotidyltransferase domain-containing protein [Thermoanaerobaculia bacterium]